MQTKTYLRSDTFQAFQFTRELNDRIVSHYQGESTIKMPDWFPLMFHWKSQKKPVVCPDFARSLYLEEDAGPVILWISKDVLHNARIDDWIVQSRDGLIFPVSDIEFGRKYRDYYDG